MNYKRFFEFILWTTVAMMDVNGFKISNYFKDMQASVADSDTYLTPPQIIRKHGYPAEAHIVQSADGYLLEMHRIPHGKAGPGEGKRIPILLHHGLLCSSIDWIINGPEKSLGYRLADAGYDVWMANARGNTFSRGHIKYSPTQREFWDFSFHEMGIYDLPACIDHVLNTTGEQQLVYIGHSLGTTTFYAMASTLPEYNKKIKFQISLAPVAVLSHATSAFRLMVPYAYLIHDMSDWYNKGAFMEHDVMTKIFCKIFCGKDYFHTNICEQLIIFRLFGKDPEQFNTDLIPLMSSNMPAGTSGKNMIHCSQLISAGTFQYYDYGKAGNIKKYRTATPPAYNLSSITVPIRVYYGPNDILSDPLDCQLTYQKFSKPLGLVRVNYEKFNHVDFLWAKDVNTLLNDELIQFVKNSTDFYSGSEFIEENVRDAVEIRNNTIAPVDVPFDTQNYLLNYPNGFPVPGGMSPEDLVRYPKMVQEKMTQGVIQIQTDVAAAVKTSNKVIEGAMTQGINQVLSAGTQMRNDFENNANKVNEVVQQQMANAKSTVEKTKADLENKIKESLFKLESILGK